LACSGVFRTEYYFYVPSLGLLNAIKVCYGTRIDDASKELTLFCTQVNGDPGRVSTRGAVLNPQKAQNTIVS
jgi:hypothetical protein